jgi:type IV secretory pathway TrbL component
MAPNDPHTFSRKELERARARDIELNERYASEYEQWQRQHRAAAEQKQRDAAASAYQHDWATR